MALVQDDLENTSCHIDYVTWRTIVNIVLQFFCVARFICIQQIKLSDIVSTTFGLNITISRGKTDQKSIGNSVVIPMKSLSEDSEIAFSPVWLIEGLLDRMNCFFLIGSAITDGFCLSKSRTRAGKVMILPGAISCGTETICFKRLIRSVAFTVRGMTLHST